MAKQKEQDSIGYRLALGSARGVFRILIWIVLVFILIYFGKKAYALGYEVFNEKPVDTGEGRAVTITLTDDMSVRQIGKLLRANGLLNESPTAFMVQEMISEYHGEILPGTYTLRTSMTADEMFPILAQYEE
ncbi:MAG: aminodeoxychorismate lyase [Eubacteriales bacterium]|nr:aminodeoxychorismate lyase [Eubacteriales bacterium]